MLLERVLEVIGQQESMGLEMAFERTWGIKREYFPGVDDNLISYGDREHLLFEDLRNRFLENLTVFGD